ncbi:MAG TPA: LysR family transcriptional regulator [Acidimicrobiales bacterium]|nr:LysR family transcriptional regulator [Acidimicrobiales bacterium]
MELRQLAAILAVADHGTFSAAADALGTVQSNVSTHVARLERELGAPLFDRSRGALTEEGVAAVERARRVMAEIDALVADVAALRNVYTGHVRLGMIGTTARWLAPKLLQVVAERHPGVHLGVFEGSSAELSGRLLAGRLDMAVSMFPVGDGDLVAQTLFDEDLVLVVSRDDSLSHRREIPMAEVRQIPMLLPMPGTVYRAELDAAFGGGRHGGAGLVAKAEVDGVRLIASLTFDGNGPAILPASAVPDYLRDQWVAVAIPGMARRRVGLMTRRRGLLSAPGRAVRDLLLQVVSAQVASGRVGIYPPAGAPA